MICFHLFFIASSNGMKLMSNKFFFRIATLLFRYFFLITIIAIMSVYWLEWLCRDRALIEHHLDSWRKFWLRQNDMWFERFGILIEMKRTIVHPMIIVLLSATSTMANRDTNDKMGYLNRGSYNKFWDEFTSYTVMLFMVSCDEVFFPGINIQSLYYSRSHLLPTVG